MLFRGSRLAALQRIAGIDLQLYNRFLEPMVNILLNPAAVDMMSRFAVRAHGLF